MLLRYFYYFIGISYNFIQQYDLFFEYLSFTACSILIEILIYNKKIEFFNTYVNLNDL